MGNICQHTRDLAQKETVCLIKLVRGLQNISAGRQQQFCWFSTRINVPYKGQKKSEILDKENIHQTYKRTYG